MGQHTLGPPRRRKLGGLCQFSPCIDIILRSRKAHFSGTVEATQKKTLTANQILKTAYGVTEMEDCLEKNV